MLRIIGCIATLHDIRLVLMACGICLLAALAAVQMLLHAQAAKGRARLVWVASGGIAFGSGAWVTHFVSILAYRPGMPVAFDIWLTLLSYAWACCGGWLGLFIGLRRGVTAAIVSGLVLGFAIGTMHFTGMLAWQVPGVISYSTNFVVAAWGSALVLAPLAMLRLRANHRHQATLLLVMAVGVLHFCGMASLSISAGGAAMPGLARASLALAALAVALIVLLASLGCVLTDQLLQRRLLLEGERFHRFADATFEGLFFLAGDIVTDANIVICGMLGRPATDIIGAKLAGFVVPESRAALAALREGECGSKEMELLTAGGRLVVDMLARPFSDGVASDAVIAVRDATDRKLAEQRIEELAFSDPLTGLANRALLHRRLAQEIATCEQSGGGLALLCLDLDRFKAVNDLLGHHGGDCLLIEVANRLRAVTRGGDIVGRLGGDEFVVVQTRTCQPASAQALADRLVQDLALPFIIDGRSMEVTASIGVALYPAGGIDVETLLKQADLALYRAKQDGRCAWRFFAPSMDSKIRARREMEQDLRFALGKGELHLLYQPVFEAAQCRITGYEALLRWRHPVRGNVGPGEFIPLAEECGIISSIGFWVLETACTQAAGWPADTIIAVNLSPAQFRQPDLAGEIGRVLVRTGLAAERLELEVTEGVLIGDPDSALSIMSALKARGIRLALDDFGAGYSSLSYLRRFPFDRLKIDCAFISELGKDAAADAIVRCIITMAESLGMAVTAEGVETPAQLQTLRAMHCNAVQGFLLGHPCPAPEFAQPNLRVVAG